MAPEVKIAERFRARHWEQDGGSQVMATNKKSEIGE
jgi:hypothetical protein